MVNKTYISILVLLAVAIGGNYNTFAQNGRVDEIQSVLSSFKQYRFGAVNVYEITNTSEVKEILDAKKSAADGGTDMKKAEELLEQVSAEIRRLIEEGVIAEKTLSQVSQDLILNGYDLPDQDVFKAVYDYFVTKNTGGTQQLDMKIYAVTTQPEQVGELPKEIIGVLVIEKPFEEMTSDLKENLEFVDPSMIYSYRMLRGEELDKSKYGYENMYDLVYSYFIQGGYSNKTMEARGIGTDIRYFDEQVGVTNALIDYTVPGVKNTDIQTFKRISFGEPQKYKGKNMEVLVSADQIRWVKYPMFFVERRGKLQLDSLGNPVVDERRANNSELPQIGFDLKYGADDINMPSFTSERLSLSAIWGKVKLGAILPTAGWANLQTDLFDINRKMTHGGFGVVGEFDFDLPIIPKSDVFRMSFGYTFGDPVSPDYGAKNIGSMIDDNPIANSYLVGDNRNNDYMLRVNSTLQYTFGLSIDEDYLFRIGVGGSFYSMENWRYRIMNDENNIPEGSEYYKYDTETVGGISAKLDFMVQNVNTPYGASLSYFDETLNMNLFVQFPVVENMLYLKLKANGNIILREFDRPWENGGFFMPNINLIYVF